MKLCKSRIVVLLAIFAVLGGCVTNSLVLGYFYGRMDNSMHDRMLQYASFDQQQKDQIRQSVNQFFDWHRSSELPRYADYLQLIISQLESGDYDTSTIEVHVDRVRQFSQVSFARSPVAGAAPFLKSLSDDQVEQVAAHMRKKDDDFLTWYEERQKKDVEAERLRSIAKNVGRLGITLDEEQVEIIRHGLAGFRNDPMTRFRVWNRWERELVTLLKNRSDNGFETRVQQHLSTYQDQMRLHDPDNHRFNQENSAKLVYQVLESLDSGQKAKLLKKLGKIRNSLNKISRT